MNRRVYMISYDLECGLTMYMYTIHVCSSVAEYSYMTVMHSVHVECSVLTCTSKCSGIRYFD